VLRIICRMIVRTCGHVGMAKACNTVQLLNWTDLWVLVECYVINRGEFKNDNHNIHYYTGRVVGRISI